MAQNLCYAGILASGIFSSLDLLNSLITFVTRKFQIYMADVHKGLDNIEQLTLQLVEKYEQARSENDSLRIQLRKLDEELTESRGKVELLNEELKSAKIARAVAISSEDNELAKAKIATLVREIDRCIALLNE